MQIEAPYLLFLGDTTHALDAKTASGILDWRPDLCSGQCRLAADAVDLGLPDFTPSEAAAAGMRTMVIGVAPFGGAIAPQWIEAILAAIRAGLDIASGMHSRLVDVPVIAAAAHEAGVRLLDVRHGTGGFDIASGRKRMGCRLLTVGVDCAVGKKYAALAIHRELVRRGIAADFRATGQTGIFIAGGGVAIDATICDFTAGAAESLSPDNAPDHWDVIEGQGSLFHPAYAGVSLALLHGSQPDALVVCHDPRRTHIDGYPDYPLPTLAACIAANEQAARLTNPAARVVAIALNTQGMSEAERHAALAMAYGETGLVAFDPIATGAAAVVDALLMDFSACAVVADPDRVANG
ncbi:MAG: DUF1611 domain-containing protein [Proteobacteria bacterium]|nr:DUF1611 domain-containing protein [Pseudomonadota bacterium]